MTPRPPPAIPWREDDGGRAAAGFRGHTRDCVCRAIAIAANRPYLEIYNRLIELAAHERPRAGRRRSHPRTGVRRPTYQRLLAELGFAWHPATGIGQGIRVHLATAELPSGRLVVRLSKGDYVEKCRTGVDGLRHSYVFSS